MRSSILPATLMATLLSGAAWADITIGLAGPITGANAAYGEQMRRGAEAAVADINAAGGVNGETVKLVVGDDACDPKQAVAVANQMVQQGATFIAGHFCSGSSIPASQVYNEEGVLMITPASTNPQLTEQGFEHVFRVCGRDDQQGVVAANHLAKAFAGKKIAIVHDKQSYSKGLADATKANLNKAGVTEVAYETVNPGERDYTALVTKLKSLGTDVLYYGGYHTEAGLILRQMREQGMQTQLVSGDAVVTQEFWSITGPAGEGTLVTFGPDATKRPEAKGVVERIRATGYEPEGYTLYTYATVQAWAVAAKRAKSAEPAKVSAQLRQGDYETVIGRIGFNEKGDRTTADYVFYTWTGGKAVQKDS
ncbi:MAG TPA: branched-chain amino acid ABC transporter substrate-binding protein [Alphaproteobacteria bacterium]|nr:branched-chain amino acid ABC transporter substrate-binding protein [Alphaproteobacteria bacterium]